MFSVLCQGRSAQNHRTMIVSCLIAQTTLVASIKPILAFVGYKYYICWSSNPESIVTVAFLWQWLEHAGPHKIWVHDNDLNVLPENLCLIGITIPRRGLIFGSIDDFNSPIYIYILYIYIYTCVCAYYNMHIYI